MNTLQAPQRWLQREINVVVIGAGGNGGEAIDALAQFHTALLALGHPSGLNVTIYDDGIVREPNIVRQRFWACDIGQNKAISLANRYNLMMGLQWEGVPKRFTEDSVSYSTDLLITAVDTPSARKQVHDALIANKHAPIWLDLGNNARNGQVVIGHAGNAEYPSVFDRYPEAADLPDNDRKSCSTAEAIAAQDCLVNRVVASAGMTLVWELLRYGKTAKNGLVIDLASGRQVPIPFPRQHDQLAANDTPLSKTSAA